MHSFEVQLHLNKKTTNTTTTRLSIQRNQKNNIQFYNCYFLLISQNKVTISFHFKAARIKAARVEAARVEAARVEATRVEAARVEAARVQAARRRAAEQRANDDGFLSATEREMYEISRWRRNGNSSRPEYGQWNNYGCHYLRYGNMRRREERY